MVYGVSGRWGGVVIFIFRIGSKSNFGIFFLGGGRLGDDHFVWHASSSWVVIRLHPEFG